MNFDTLEHQTDDRAADAAAREKSPASKQPNNDRRRRWMRVAAIVLLLAVVIAAGAILLLRNVRIVRTEEAVSLVFEKRQREKKTTEPSEETEQPEKVSDPALHIVSDRTLAVTPSIPGAPNAPSSAEDALSLQEIYEKTLPSVVTVTASRTRGSLIGTGIFISEDGYILTNASYIERAASLTVTVNGNENYEAVVIGSDTSSDIAVLKIDANGLTSAEFGDSDALRIGDLAVTICSPSAAGMSCIMTDGIISGINSELSANGWRIAQLQTSSAPGVNASGVLLNCYGQVIGIHTLRFSRSGFSMRENEELCFAIPISIVKPVVDELIEKGYVSGRPSIGVSVEDLPERARVYYGLPSGAYVTFVQPGSGAEKAGIQSGDIITALNEQAITSASALEQIRNSYSAGDVVDLTVYRDGQFFHASVRLILQEQDG